MTQFSMYAPWDSFPADIPATRALLPASVERTIMEAMIILVYRWSPLDSRSKSDLHAPGVIEFDDDWGSFRLDLA
jgi:hypothetical protein